jgi:DedD protein
MAAAQDVEISLGTGRLLGLFFALVVVCGIFFGLGYTVGRNAGPATPAEAAAPAATTTAAKPKAAAGAPAEIANTTPANDLTFYKAVEQKDANPQLTPSSNPPPATASNATAPETPRSSAYVVQIAAVSKKEDAEALVGVLRKKNYPVFLAGNGPSDSLFHVQVGPFNDLKDAEAMRGRLAGDGYSPIVKK